MLACLRVSWAVSVPFSRLLLEKDTSLPPKPKATPAGRFSHAGARASGGTLPI